MIASMQPYHVIDDGRWAEGRIGPKRVPRRLRLPRRCSTPGPSWPSAPTGRWRRSTRSSGIDAAVNRRTLDGKHPGGWFPDQKITLEEALRAYTAEVAYANFAERTRGQLEPGPQGRPGHLRP